MLRDFNEDNKSLINSNQTANSKSIELIRQEMDRRLEEIRELIEIMSGKVMRRVEIDKFEDYKKLTSNRLDTDAMKVKDLSKKVDTYDRKFEVLNAEIDTKFREFWLKFGNLESRLEKELKALEERTKDLKSNGNQFGDNGDLMAFFKKHFACDVHKEPTEGGLMMDRLIKAEEEILSLKNTQSKVDAALVIVQQEVAHKLDSVTFSQQIGKKIDRDELLDLLKPFEKDESNMRKLMQEVSKMKKKLKEMTEFVENKIKEFKKDFDMPYLLKTIKCKAEEKDVKAQFKSMQDTLSEKNLLLTNLKKDLDNLLIAYKKLSQFLSLLNSEDASTLASSKLLCLSCGRGSKFPPELKQVAESY